MIGSETVVHVVPEGDGSKYHILYLRDGRIVRFALETGEVEALGKLPSTETINAAKPPEKGTWSVFNWEM